MQFGPTQVPADTAPMHVILSIGRVLHQVPSYVFCNLIQSTLDPSLSACHAVAMCTFAGMPAGPSQVQAPHPHRAWYIDSPFLTFRTRQPDTTPCNIHSVTCTPDPSRLVSLAQDRESCYSRSLVTSPPPHNF